MLDRFGEDFRGDQRRLPMFVPRWGERRPFVKRSDVWPTTSSNSSLVTIGTLR